ncbi:unnamed protein product [Cylicostephanus goldi]|uniref:XPA C-terminal domain-containing protein n=1 Tax=Cylicostephanus goldi TaxID=71465 RepID=A0A3P7NEV2_CYLGO|nr:unnamed protein product [Cylicostephanus goldi]
MSKRRFNPSDEDKIPIVEKLYRQNQPSFQAAGGFMDDDDEYQQRREEISEAKQRTGGFMDDDDEYQQRREEISEAKQRRADAKFASQEIPDNCIKCDKPMFDSWLWERYNHPVCDGCR